MNALAVGVEEKGLPKTILKYLVYYALVTGFRLYIFVS